MTGDDRRYLLTAPRGVDPLLDAVAPHAEHHTITVYGSQDLARRVALAHQAGVCVSWREAATPEPVLSISDADDDAAGV